MENIIVSNSDEFHKLISDFKYIFTSNVEKLQEIAEDDNQAFVKRKIIGMMTSDDESLSLKSIQWIHDLITSANNVQLQISSQEININTGTFILTSAQKAIYSKVKKEVKSNLPGDDHLLKLLAINIDHHNQAVSIINSTGFKMEFKTGAQQVRPEVTIKRDCENRINEIFRELCMTSLSQSKVNKAGKEPIKKTLSAVLSMQKVN